MKKIKRFEKKENKSKEQEVKFNVQDLSDNLPGFRTEVEDSEEVSKKFKKEIDKIEKFEAFIDVHIDNIENVEVEYDFGKNDDDDDDDDFDAEYEEDNGCDCCRDCTGEPGCYCGCDDCKCAEMEIEVVPASKVIGGQISENLKYHLDNNMPVTESIFRPGSEEFYRVIKEARNNFELGKIKLTDIDNEIFESTEIGKFAYFKGKLVALDIPMENIEELNEAEYKGKEVKLNYPMRGGTKKYYVYVKNPKTGKVKKISFGDVKGGLTAKVSNPEARKSFAARHKCSMKKDKTKAGYWACRLNRYGHLFGGKTYPGYW